MRGIAVKTPIGIAEFAQSWRPSFDKPCESVGCSSRTCGAVRNFDACPAIAPEMQCRCPPKRCMDCETQLANTAWVNQFMATKNFHCCVECQDCGKSYCIHSLRRVAFTPAYASTTTTTTMMTAPAVPSAAQVRAQQADYIAKLEEEKRKAERLSMTLFLNHPLPLYIRAN